MIISGTMKKRKLLLLLSILSAGAVFLSSCSEQSEKQINTISEIKEHPYNLGVLQGTYSQEEVPTLFPKSAEKVFVYNDVSSAYRALQQGKIDVLFQDRSIARVDIAKGVEGVKIIDEEFGNTYNVAIGVSDQAENKIELTIVNDILNKFKANGILDDMYDRWSKTGDYTMPEITPTYDPSNPALIVATSGVSEPFSFYLNGNITGYDIELSKRIANELKRPLEFIEESNYMSLVAEVQAGKAHLLIANLYDTIERRQALKISVPYYSTSACAIVRDYSTRKGFNSLADLENKRIGYDLSSTQYYEMAKKGIKNPEMVTFQSVPDCSLALLTNRIDGFICDNPIAKYMCVKNNNLKIVPEYIAEDNYGFMLQKNSRYTSLFNEALAELKAKGIGKALEDKWFDPNASGKHVEEQKGTYSQTLRASTTCLLEPMNFYGPNGTVEGFEYDLLIALGDKLGFKIEITEVVNSVTACMTALESNKVDIVFNTMSITEERRQKVDFTDSYYNGAVVVVVRNENIKNLNFWERLAESFRKTFVVEERWKSILYGLGVTLIMSVVSGVIGLALGSGICAIRRSRSKAARKVSAAFIHIIQGTPAVVLLMILYYIVFGKINIDAVIVAIIGFSVMFGVYSSEIMRSGFDSVDKGQIEAALALGYTRRQAFTKISLPQAAHKFIPVLTGEFISMVKMTSIAGYISVTELTRIGDIIRTKTMEAFFPLVVIALIYFGLCELLTFGLRLLHKKLDPKHHAKKVKGVYVIDEKADD